MSYDLVELGAIATFINGDRGKNYPSKDSFVKEGIAFINAGCLSEDNKLDSSKLNYITEDNYNRLSSGKIQRNDILFCLRGSLGKFAVIRNDNLGALASSLVIIRVKSNVNVEYLKHYFSSSLAKKEIDSYENGAAQPNLSATDLKKFTMPLPPLPEQKRIADILDKADELRQKRQQSIAKLDELLQANFIDMFGDPVNNPKGWLKCAVGEIANCIVPARDKPKTFTGNIPWITIDDLIPLNYTSKSKTNIGLTDNEVLSAKARLIPENSVIMSCVGNLGVTSIARNKFVMNQQLHSFQCKEKMLPEFLVFCLPFEKRYMFSRATSTTLPYMNKSVCNSVPVIVPPINLQHEWVKKFKQIQTQKNLLTQQLTQQNQLFQSLQQQAFKGTL